MAAEIRGLLLSYYRSPSVRNRMCEFLGGSNLGNATAVYIVASDGYSGCGEPSRPCFLASYLDNGLDVERSLWDREFLVADLDLDYENFDSAVAVYVDPARVFALEEPVVTTTLEILAMTGIAPLTLVSGRGFHLVWRISRTSEAFHRLATLGRLPPSLTAKYARPRSPTGEGLEPDLGRAFAGLGMVLELVAHRVLFTAAPQCLLPLKITSIEVGTGAQGREIVSFDLSEYGDPLYLRHVRMPFSSYLKPRQLLWALGEEGLGQILPLFEIPLLDLKLPQAIAIMRDPEEVLKLSRQVSAGIPDGSEGMLALIEDYQHSELAGFHEWFYSIGDEEARRSMAAQGGAAGEAVPPCTRWVLEHPNNWLLKPAALENVARVLTALNWHPRTIAELIRSRYEADCGWGDLWVEEDPSWRAIFYTRLFTGLIATGCDKLIDFNCVSHKEKGYCMIPECSYNLVSYRDLLR